MQGCTTDNLVDLIVFALCFFSGLSDEEVVECLVCFGADGDPAFQGARAGVIAQLTKRHAPYMLGIHYVAHKT